MISTLKRLLENENCVVSGDEKIAINLTESGTAYPEDYLQINPEDGLYEIWEIHRDRKKLIVSSQSKQDTCVWAALAYKRLFSKDVNRKNAGIIIDYVNAGEIERVLQLLDENALKSYYSIGFEEHDRISLIIEGKSATVKYAGECIVTNVPLFQGYVVLCNFSEILKAVTKYYHDYIKSVPCGVDFDHLAKFYVFGKV